MKKLLFLALIIVIVLLLVGYVITQKTKTNISGSYLGSQYKGNYVWGGAMNLAWNELNDNILHQKLKLKTDNKLALNMVEKLNNPVFTTNDLDDKSYYVKSGYGQATVNTINQESKAKFPTKSFSDLKMSLSPTDIISYAYFLKEVQYKTAFVKKDVSFGSQKVKGFYAKGKGQRNNVKIIKYESDDKFIVSLQLKDESDQLILAKGYDMTNPQITINEINKNNNNLLTLGTSDHFEAPKLHLDHNRKYTELMGEYLANQGFEEYFIAQMFENIKFDMDEKGVRVENEAVIALNKMFLQTEPEKPKNLILNRPYWVIMQRKNSQTPYFILGVNNTELMEK